MWTLSSIMIGMPSHSPMSLYYSVRHLFPGQRRIELLCALGPAKCVAHKLP